LKPLPNPSPLKGEGLESVGLAGRNLYERATPATGVPRPTSNTGFRASPRHPGFSLRCNPGYSKPGYLKMGHSLPVCGALKPLPPGGGEVWREGGGAAGTVL